MLGVVLTALAGLSDHQSTEAYNADAALATVMTERENGGHGIALNPRVSRLLAAA